MVVNTNCESEFETHKFVYYYPPTPCFAFQGSASVLAPALSCTTAAVLALPADSISGAPIATPFTLSCNGLRAVRRVLSLSICGQFWNDRYLILCSEKSSVHQSSTLRRSAFPNTLAGLVGSTGK